MNRVGSSMLWPFLTIYIYNTLGLPLTSVALLLGLRSIFSILATAIVSPLMDRIGRKGAMTLGMFGTALAFYGMLYGGKSLLLWAFLIAFQGIVLPIFNIGVQAMVADMITVPEKRSPAYALIRMVSNAGIAIGPIIGGSLAVISFELVFKITTVIFLVLTVLIQLFIQETVPQREKSKHGEKHERFAYSFLLTDGIFVSFILVYFLVEMAYSQIWTLFAVYVSENFGLAENQYSLIVTVNAAMVVFLQYSVTKFTAHHRPYNMIMIGALLYAVGLASFGLGWLLPHFMLSMVIVTLGELLISPTASTLVANMSPEHMRARYLGILSLAYPIGSGMGPIIGGLLNDYISPQAIWYGAGIMALLGTLGFFYLSRYQAHKMPILAKST